MVKNTFIYRWWCTPECRIARRQMYKDIAEVGSLSNRTLEEEKELSARAVKAQSLKLTDALMKAAASVTQYLEVHESSGCEYGPRIRFTKEKKK